MAQTIFPFQAAPITLVRWGGQNKAELAAACAGKHSLCFCADKYVVVCTWTDQNQPPLVTIASVGEFIMLAPGDEMTPAGSILTRRQANDRYPGVAP